MKGVLYGVGEGKRGHADGTPEGQGDGKVAQDADDPDCYRNDGVFTRIESGYQELIQGHKRELVGVVLQGNSGASSVLGSVVAVAEKQVDDRLTQHNQADGGRNHEQQPNAES